MPGLAVASGSACNSASAEPSHVLRSLGRSDQLAEASIRFSFGRFTELVHIEQAAGQFRAAVEHVARLAEGAAA